MVLAFKKIKVILAVLLVPLLAVFLVLTRAETTKAGSISSISVTASNNAKGATSDYTIVFTPSTAIDSQAHVNISFMAPNDAKFNTSSVQSSGIGVGSSDIFTEFYYSDVQYSSFGVRSSSLTATEKTLIVKNVVNPSKSGTYGVRIETRNGFSQVDEGQGSVQVGTIALQGTVSKPAGAGGGGCGDVWVQAVDTTDFSRRFGVPTASDGTYGIGDLDSGKTYRIETHINSYPESVSKGFSPAESVTVTYSGVLLTQNFTLKQPTKTVTGRIVKDNGQAVSSGRIMAGRMDGPGWTNAQTSADGSYTLNLTGGTWEVRPDTFAGPGQAPPDYAFSGPGKTIKFAKSETVESQADVNFTVVIASATIRGSVNPKPTNFAGIGIHSRSGFGTGTGIDPNTGTFETKVPAGTYEIEYFSGGGPGGGGSGDSYAMPEMAAVSVGNNETKDLGAINLVKMDKSINVTVRDSDTKQGLGNFDIGCFKPRGGGFAHSRTGSNGQGVVKVTSGKWGCMAFSGFGGKEGGPPQARIMDYLIMRAYAAEGAAQEKYVMQGGPKFVDVGDSASITFDAVKADRTITVTVTDSSGNPLSEHGFIEAELVGSGAGGGSDFDKGGGLGEPIDPNQPGMATLTVPAGVYDLRMMTPPGSDYSSGDATRVDVTTATTASATIKLLANDSTISGTVKDEDGNTVTNTFVFVTASNKKGAFIPGDVNTADGTYSMGVPSAGGELNLGYFVDPGSGYFPQPVSDNTITPEANAVHTRDIVMRKATTTVNFTVKNPDGNAVEGAFVEADNRKYDRGMKMGGMFSHGLETGADGKISLRLPAGEYTFSAFISPDELRTNKWMPPKGEKVTLAKNDTKNVTLTFQKADIELTGTVKDESGDLMSEAFLTAYSKDGEAIEVNANTEGTYSVFVTANEWHLIAEKDQADEGTSKPEPLISDDQGVDTAGKTKITENIVVKDIGDLSIPISSTFDTDNAKQVSVNDGDLSGAKVAIPQDALDTDGQGSNATISVQTTVETPRQLLDKPLGGIALDISAQNSNGQAITSTNSSVAITIPVKYGDLEGAGLDETDIGTKANMSYYDTTKGKWTPLEGSVTKVGIDQNGDGDTTDENDVIQVTGQSSHFTSFAVTAATDTIPPAAPTNIAASDVRTGGKVKLTWTNPTDSDFDKVKIYRSTTEGSLGTAVGTTTSASTTEYTDTGLTDGTKYYFTVKSVDTSSNESANTSQVNATPSSFDLPRTGASGIWSLISSLIRSTFN